MTTSTGTNALMEIIHTEAVAAAGRAGLSERAARDVAESIRESVALQLGGSRIYVPVSRMDQERRNARIRREFNGRNVDELAQRYGLARRTVYAIVNAPFDSADQGSKIRNGL